MPREELILQPQRSQSIVRATSELIHPHSLQTLPWRSRRTPLVLACIAGTLFLLIIFGAGIWVGRTRRGSSTDEGSAVHTPPAIQLEKGATSQGNGTVSPRDTFADSLIGITWETSSKNRAKGRITFLRDGRVKDVGAGENWFTPGETRWAVIDENRVIVLEAPGWVGIYYFNKELTRIAVYYGGREESKPSWEASRITE